MDTRESIGKTKRVVLIKTNLLDVDPRLAKEIDTLKRGGYAVTLLCWDRNSKASSRKQKEEEEDYNEIQLRFKAPFGVKILPFLPIWWFFVFFQLMIRRCDIVHAINFDSIIPAGIAAKMRRKTIIYEMFDTYEDGVVLPRIIRNIFVYIDKIFMRAARVVIIVDESRIKEFNGIPNANIIVIYNSPPGSLRKFNAPSQEDNAFIIFFAGVLYRSRRMNLDKVFQAIKDINGVRVIVAGYGDCPKAIKKWANKSAGKVKFIGKISYTEVLERTMAANLLIALYAPTILNTLYTSANKLFEAMMCHKPILVSKGTRTADIVEKEGCGLVVDCNSVDEIRKAILRLKEDPDLCRQLGANGRRAYEERYNWEIMEKRLLALYQGLTGGRA